MKFKDEAIFCDCGFCGSRFQFGPHSYDGHYLPIYDLRVCKGCIPDKMSDIPNEYEHVALNKLKLLGNNKPQRNSNGGLIAF